MKGGNRIDSPTPATDPDEGVPMDVKGIMANSRIKVNKRFAIGYLSQ